MKPLPLLLLGTLSLQANFELVENFDVLLNGDINNQANWKANPPGAFDGAEVSPGPNVFSRKALQNNPFGVASRGNAYNRLTSDQRIEENASGTLFFQIYFDDISDTNLHLGLSDVTDPVLNGPGIDFDDFEAEIRFDPSGLSARHGNTWTLLPNVTLENETVFHVWMVINNQTDTFEVYVQSGEEGSQVLAESLDGTTTFNFRNGTQSPLRTFMHFNEGVHFTDTYLDSIYIDASGLNLIHPAHLWTSVENFETVSGSLNGQNGWSTFGNGGLIITDPDDSENQCFQLNTNSGSGAYKNTLLPQGSTGTLFFRIRTAGNTNFGAGLSDEATPDSWSSFETQINTQNTQTLNIRDGSVFRSAGTLTAESWYCVWMVIDNTLDRYEVYLEGGPYSEPTLLEASTTGQTDFGFRNGIATHDLIRFFIHSANAQNTLCFDDIYLDSRTDNLSRPSNLKDFDKTTTPGNDTLPIADPIPETIQFSGVDIRLIEFAQVPASRASAPLARINYLRPIGDNTGRLFVNDLEGFLYVINSQGNVSLYLDLKAQFPRFAKNGSLNAGFASFTVHPDFANNGLFYTIHTESPNGSPAPDFESDPPRTSYDKHGVIIEWQASDPTANTFSGSHRELMRIAAPTALHGLQLVEFNPNARPGDADYGMLYISHGDGEEVPFFSQSPQRLQSPHGSIMRIDPLGNNSANGQYGIPSDNPYFESTDTTVSKEIWAHGFRNPHRFCWDTQGAQKMLVGDIGQKNIEEVNWVLPGHNYGWNEREGTFRFNQSDPNNVYPLPADDETLGYTYPVAQLDHDEAFAIVGGFVYRGTTVPALMGKYIFGDIVRGRIYYADVDAMQLGTQATIHQLALKDAQGNPIDMYDLVTPSSRIDLRFGIDAENELYFLSKQNGKIWKMENGTSPAPVEVWRATHFTPTELMQANISALTADPDRDGKTNLIEYTMGSHPRIADNEAATQFSISGGKLQFQFTRHEDADDLIFEIGTSVNLSNWDYLDHGLIPTPGSPFDNGNGTWRYQFEETIPSEDLHRFYHLRVSTIE